MTDVMNQIIRRKPLDAGQQRGQAIRSAAASAGFVNAGDAERMLDGQDGDPAALVDELARAKPHLLTASAQFSRRIRGTDEPEPEPATATDAPRNWGSADGGNSGTVPEAPPDMNRLLRREYTILRRGYDPEPNY